MDADIGDEVRVILAEFSRLGVVKSISFYKFNKVVFSTMPPDVAEKILEQYLETEVKAVWSTDLDTIFFFAKEYTIAIKPANLITLYNGLRIVRRWLESIKRREAEKQEEIYGEIAAIPATPEEPEVVEPDRLTGEVVEKLLEITTYLLGDETASEIIRKSGGRDRLFYKDGIEEFRRNLEELIGGRLAELIIGNVLGKS